MRPSLVRKLFQGFLSCRTTERSWKSKGGCKRSRLRILRGCKIRFWRWVYSLILKSLLILNVKSSHTNGSVCLMAGECGHIFFPPRSESRLANQTGKIWGGQRIDRVLLIRVRLALPYTFPCLEC